MASVPRKEQVFGGEGRNLFRFSTPDPPLWVELLLRLSVRDSRCLH